MTAEERIRSLHTRMDALRRMRERRKTGLTGAACAAVALCLVCLIFDGGAAHGGGAAGLYSGAMLFENAGGYVLAAIAAFMAGVVITAAILKKIKPDSRGDKNESLKNGEEDHHETKDEDR